MTRIEERLFIRRIGFALNCTITILFYLRRFPYILH